MGHGHGQSQIANLQIFQPNGEFVDGQTIHSSIWREEIGNRNPQSATYATTHHLTTSFTYLWCTIDDSSTRRWNEEEPMYAPPSFIII